MADEIVTCPGCSKRYTVPEGTPPGQFQCQDCGAAVAYGQDSIPAAVPAPAAPARPARPARRGSGGRRGRARGRRRGREDEPEDDDGRRRGRGAAAKKKDDPTPWILGIVVVALLAFIGIVMANKSDDGATGTESADAGEGGRNYSTDIGSATTLQGSGDTGGEEDGPTGGAEATAGDSGSSDEPLPDAFGGLNTRKRDDKPLDTFKRAEVLPEGGNYGVGVDELRALAREDRSALVAPLGHLPDTSADLAAEIDQLVKVVADPYAGREALDAKRRLIEIGRASIPALLSAFAELDFTKYDNMLDARDPCVVADAVDFALRDITSKTNITKLQYNPRGKLRVYTKVIENWYVWWLNTGYERAEFPKIEETWEDEEEL